MENLSSELTSRLTKLAERKSIPYCYGCAQEAPRGRCPSCFSDDLMRLVPGEGCDWGYEWIIRALVRDNVDALDTEQAFEESIGVCYPETTKVGWMELDTVRTMKEIDPIAWDLAESEWISNEESDGLIVSFDHGSTYYSVHEIERYLDAEHDDSTAHILLGAGGRVHLAVPGIKTPASAG